MTTLTATRETTGGVRSADALITRAHQLLGDCGIEMSSSKVSRIVRQFKKRVEANGFKFEAFLVNSVQLTAEQRRNALAHPDIARVISYADPTGEEAITHVLRERAARS